MEKAAITPSDELLEKYDAKVVIEGHADERNSFDYALALGEKRAQAVKNHLMSLEKWD